MDLEYFVEPVFKIDFLKIKCNDWKNKKTNLKTTMDHKTHNIPWINFLKLYQSMENQILFLMN